MNLVYLLVLIPVITHNVNGLKVDALGIFSNITSILQRITDIGHGRKPNYLPDITSNDNTKKRLMDMDVRRYHLKRYIEALKKTMVNDESKELISDDFTDYDETAKHGNIVSGNKQDKEEEEISDLRKALQQTPEGKMSKKERKQRNYMREQHRQRIKEITMFMENAYNATLYLYSEVKRIKEQRVVLDDLREMVRYLEHDDRKALKEDVLKCYEKLRKHFKVKKDIWKIAKTNNLVINTLKDPMNYGYIN